MKILYFSGTGNSYATASLIAGRMGELYDMGDCSFEEEFNDEYVGIVTPCYCSDIPAKVREFLSKAKINSQYIFAVVTCGASAGNSFISINECLKKNNAKLSYIKKLVLPDNCILFATPTKLAMEQMKNHKNMVAQINKELAEKKVNVKKLSAKKTPALITKFSWFLFKKIYKIDAKKTNGRCIACGKCVDFCPVHNIKMEGKKVIFGENCENCFACIQRCPNMAIDFGKLRITNSKRYIHPIFVDGKEFR